MLKKRKQTKTRKNKVQTWVILCDVHYPYHDKPAVRAVLQFIRKNRSQLAGVVIAGDGLDCDQLSHHTKSKPRLRKRGGYKEDLEGFKTEILDRIEEALGNRNKKVEKVYIMGNHERFIEDLLDEMPELEGVVGIAENLDLKKRGWRVVPVGGHFQVANVVILHGDQIGSATHVAKKLVDEVNHISLMGHVHRFSAFTKIGIRPEDKWLGITLPCLSTLAPAYAKGKLNAFLHGFGIIEVRSRKRVNIYVVIVTDGQFSFAGRIYKGA